MSLNEFLENVGFIVVFLIPLGLGIGWLVNLWPEWEEKKEREKYGVDWKGNINWPQK